MLSTKNSYIKKNSLVVANIYKLLYETCINKNLKNNFKHYQEK